MSVNCIQAKARRFKFKNTVFKDTKGTTAIEFSLLAIPFVFTVVSIIELSLYFATSSVIDGALGEVSRQVRTGQLQQLATLQEMEDQFNQVVCNHGDVLTVCDKIEFEVMRLDAFTTDIAASVDENGALADPAFDLDEVSAGCVTLVRLSYLYQFLTPLYGTLWSNYPDNQRLMLATTVLKTEPYDFETDEGCSI